MIQSAMKIIQIREIVNMIHDVIGTANTMTAAHRGKTGDRQQKTNQGTHASPFPAGQDDFERSEANVPCGLDRTPYLPDRI